MKTLFALYAAFLLWSFPASSAIPDSQKIDGVWLNEGGRPLPNEPHRKAQAGFAGWLLVISDQDWERKWNTSEETIPKFSEVDSLRKGQEVTVLIIYSNPLPDDDGKIHLTCDLKIERPDGTYSADQAGIECVNEKLQGQPRNVRLTSLIIKFSGDQTDPVGLWKFSVAVRDANRKVTLELQKNVELRNER